MNGVFNRKTKVTDLSGGEKQRLMLLRALSIKPDFLLMDEPTTGLDSDVKLHFLNQVREIVLDQSILAIYVTHHKLETELIMDEIIYFDSNNSTGIDHVYQKDIETFMDTPPVLDAVSALNYPLVNLVRFSIGNDGYINACEAEAKESFIISLQPSITSFSKKGGIPIKLINTNHIFSLFEITGGQRIVLPTSQMHIGENLHLLVNGTINRYSESSSKHIDTIKIAMNKVVTNP
jgi:energy-coupling factor transporter ATP-binding protein EcfA2